MYGGRLRLMAGVARAMRRASDRESCLRPARHHHLYIKEKLEQPIIGESQQHYM